MARAPPTHPDDQAEAEKGGQAATVCRPTPHPRNVRSRHAPQPRCIRHKGARAPPPHAKGCAELGPNGGGRPAAASLHHHPLRRGPGRRTAATATVTLRMGHSCTAGHKIRSLQAPLPSGPPRLPLLTPTPTPSHSVEKAPSEGRRGTQATLVGLWNDATPQVRWYKGRHTLSHVRHAQARPAASRWPSGGRRPEQPRHHDHGTKGVVVGVVVVTANERRPAPTARKRAQRRVRGFGQCVTTRRRIWMGENRGTVLCPEGWKEPTERGKEPGLWRWAAYGDATTATPPVLRWEMPSVKPRMRGGWCPHSAPESST